jgi:hypothetical protein
MVVGFTTTYAIGAYHHGCCGFDSRPGRGVQHYVIKFVSDLQQVGGFLRPLGANTSITVRGVPVVGLLIEVAGNSVIIVSFVWFGFMVFNATFNNISVISWWSVLLVEETGVPGEKHRPAASH